MCSPELFVPGGGVFFFWYLGALSVAKTPDVIWGASAGGLAAALSVVGVCPHLAMKKAIEMHFEMKLHGRWLGFALVWGEGVRRWLRQILPADAGVRCSGRLRICAFRVWPSPGPVIFCQFRDTEHLIEVLMATIHVPLFLDGRLCACVGDEYFIDGSLCPTPNRVPMLNYTRDPRTHAMRMLAAIGPKEADELFEWGRTHHPPPDLIKTAA